MRCSPATIAVTVLALSIAPSSARAQSRPVFTPEDLLAVRTFAGGQPYAVSSNGRWVAYVVTDQADDWNVQEPRPTGHVFVQAVGGRVRAAASADNGRCAQRVSRVVA
jgi:hypothetical protein